jgi:CRP/FNR family transcriptional regulator, dissimilatory nitrate respiration regulator
VALPGECGSSAGRGGAVRDYTSAMPSDVHTLSDLRAAALFTHLDDGQLERLARVAQPRQLAAEQTLFLQGDAADAFYLLAEGRLKVFKLLRDGRTATVRHVEKGQTFAEAALFQETYPSSTETLTDCLLYRFDKQQTLALLLAEPQLAVNLLAAMAHLLGLLNRRVEELLLPVPARLARYLLARADEQLTPAAGGAALPPEGPRVIRLPVSKRELAARLGTVPETLSRTFDRFKRAQVIRMSGDHRLIEILSFEQLHRLAQE